MSHNGPAKKQLVAKGAGGKAAQKPLKSKADVDEREISTEEAQETVAALFSAELLSGLESAQWKERLEALQNMKTVALGIPTPECPCQAILKVVNKKKETNFQCTNARFEIVCAVARFGFTRRAFSAVVTDIVDKIADSKHTGPCCNALSASADILGLPYVAEQVVVSATDHKNPKCLVETYNWLSKCILEFGFQLEMGLLLASLKKALGHSNPDVRKSAITLIGTVYLFVGQQLRTMFGSEKPALLQLIDEELAKHEGEKPPPPIRGPHAKRPESHPDGVSPVDNVDEATTNGPEDQQQNLEDLMPRKDISSSITDELLNELEDKNWKVRSEALSKVQQIISDAKFITSALGGLPQSLVKRLGDNNKVLVQTTLNICQMLAKAAGSKIKEHIRVVAPGIFNVLTDTKPHVRQGAVNCLNTWAESVGIKEFLQGEMLVTALKVENPNLRSELLSWLALQLPNGKRLPDADLKLCVPILFACLEDRSADVRKNAQEALLPFMNFCGYEYVNKQMGKLKPTSLSVVQPIVEKTRITLSEKGCKPSQPQTQATTSTTAKPAASESAAVVEPSSTRPSSAAVTGKAPPSKPAQAKKAGAAGGKSNAKSAAKAEYVDEVELTIEDAEEKFTTKFSAGVVAAFENTAWKERLEALQNFKTAVCSITPADCPCQAILRILYKKKETNFQCINGRLEIVTVLARFGYSRRAFGIVANELVDRIGDAKHLFLCADALTASAEALTLPYVAEQVLNYATEQKNPKSLTESFNWLARSIQEFGFELNSTKVLEILKKALQHTNPDVRKASINLIGVIHLFVGPQFRMLFDGEKPALLQQIDEELKKYEGQKAPQPTKGVAARNALTNSSSISASAGACDDVAGEEEAADVSDDEKPNVADLVPRKDISGEFNEELIALFKDKNWKVRAEALAKAHQIISDAKFIMPALGPLPEELVARLGDNNKVLVQNTLNICQILGTAIGPKVREHIRVLSPGLFSVLADSKPAIRQLSIAVLNSWVELAGMKEFLQGEIIAEALKNDNPTLKAELLSWLAQQLPKGKRLPDADLKLCVPLLFACLEDRNADVRKNAQEALVPFMQICGFDYMNKQMSKLKPSSISLVQPLLEKARTVVAETTIAPKTASVAASKPTAPLTTAVKALKEEAAENDEANSVSSATNSRASSRSASAARKSVAPKPGESSKPKKDEDEFIDRCLIDTNQKQQRFNDEKSLKILKWNFTAIRPEYIEQLKDQLSSVCKPALHSHMFHLDFKFHLKALDALIQVVELCPDATMNAMDLILKWITLRFFDTNPAVHNRCLEYVQQLFTLSENRQYKLHDLEASAFLPYLILKAGDGKDVVRAGVNKIFKQILRIYPASKLFVFVLDGVKSKNSRQRTECLDQLATIIEAYGLEVCQPNAQTALKQIAVNISDKDNTVRNAALNAIVAAYMYVGDQVYRMIGNMNEKDLSLLQERIKRSAKNRPLIKKPSPEPPDEKKVVPNSAAITPAKCEPTPNKSGTMTFTRSVAHNGVAAYYADGDEDEQGDVLSSPPKKPGMFQLDWDYIGPNPVVPSDYDASQTSDWNEADQLIAECDQIVAKYMTEKRKRDARQNEAYTRAQTIKNIVESSEAGATMDIAIAQISDKDIAKSVAALAQLDELIKDSSKCGALTGRVDKLITAIYFQYRMAYNIYIDVADSLSYENVVRLYRNLSMTLMSLVGADALILEATELPLKELFHNLITVLLDERLSSTSNGPHVIKSINVMVVKLVEKTNHTACLVALLRLLMDCVGSPTCSAKFLDIVLKCLWKTVRLLPTISGELNFDRILYEIHQFFEKYPTTYWREQGPADTPFRTLKTILHTLVKIAGDQLLDHIYLIERPASAEVVLYIKKLLKTGVGKDAVGIPPPLPAPSDARGSQPTGSQGRVKDPYKEQLLEIFKKIGSKDKTKQGLVELYDFKLENPDADFTPFLNKSSQYFRDYIQRGLQQVKSDRINSGTDFKPVKNFNDYKQFLAHFNRSAKELLAKHNLPEPTATDMEKPLSSELWKYMQTIVDCKTNLGLDTFVIEKLRPVENIQRIHRDSITSCDVDIDVQSKFTNEQTAQRTSVPMEQATEEEDTEREQELENIRARLERIKQRN